MDEQTEKPKTLHEAIVAGIYEWTNSDSPRSVLSKIIEKHVKAFLDDKQDR